MKVTTFRKTHSQETYEGTTEKYKFSLALSIDHSAIHEEVEIFELLDADGKDVLDTLEEYEELEEVVFSHLTKLREK